MRGPSGMRSPSRYGGGRSTYGGRQAAGSRYGSRRTATGGNPNRQTQSGCRRGYCGSSKQSTNTNTHKRSGSSGNTTNHSRSTSAGNSNTHARSGSYGNTNNHQRSGSYGNNNNHQRSGSYAGGGDHQRRGSYAGGGDHQRRGSYAGGGDHYRRGSYGPPRFPTVPYFTPPIPPVAAMAPPPPPPPPSAGGPQGPAAAPPPPAPRRVFLPPPAGVTDYIPDQVLVVLRDDLTNAQIGQFLAQYGLRITDGGDRRNEMTGERMFRMQILGGRSVPQVIAALQNDPRSVGAVPNYVYRLTQLQAAPANAVAPRARTNTGAYYSMQYIIAKLQLARAHQVSRGERVLIAVIDSGVDQEHPELYGTIHNMFDVTDDNERTPHLHGTSMTGAIVAQGGLMGVAPGARIVAIRAFAPDSRNPAKSGTTWHVREAIYRAIREGARVINLSLAGPADSSLKQAVDDARARGIVIVAAAGNNGPSAPAAYPAAYPGVIAVTATDYRDQPYQYANRGGYITVSAPGVDVFAIAPRGAHSMSTGTSIATAHVTGIIALMLSRNPMLDPDAVRALLLRAARVPGQGGPPEIYGAGLLDAFEAVMAAGGGVQQPAVPVASGGNQQTQ